MGWIRKTWVLPDLIAACGGNTMKSSSAGMRVWAPCSSICLSWIYTSTDCTTSEGLLTRMAALWVGLIWRNNGSTPSEDATADGAGTIKAAVATAAADSAARRRNGMIVNTSGPPLDVRSPTGL